MPESLAEFSLVYDEVKAIGGEVHKAMQKELGSICQRILENTAVFKDKQITVQFAGELGYKL